MELNFTAHCTIMNFTVPQLNELCNVLTTEHYLLQESITNTCEMSIKLRDLIRAVRACKTAAEERAVISKECALIRTAIKEEDEQYRHRNVAKLMYIHMLGYPTHFGQMECLKLISATGFPEKRIGYLALTLLLNEQTEVLTLVTNSLKIDLSNPNQYIQALSLITIGNLSTQDMARDLASDVEKLLRSNNSYLRKKAILATIRLLKKEPDLIEQMAERITALLKDRAHGVLITGLQLIIEVLDLLPHMKAEYVKLVPSLVRLLRNFISMGFSPEHDVGGITDPFMQVKLLSLLRRLGHGNDEASELMNDVLAQVATNTETSKNAGNAILYECVQTIMEVQSDSSLRVLAVNILGRFLLNRDNNIRYVALNSLSRVVNEDIAAVQRHRNTIVDCLKDADVSIRQRAMELIYQLVDQSNVIALTAELLNYLVVAQTEHKTNLVSKIIQIVEKYSPTQKWRVDTIITMLSIGGSQIDESVHRTCIIFLTQTDGLQSYATHRLYRALVDDSSQQALLHVAIWCLGEHGNLISTSYGPDSDGQTFSAVSENDILTLLDKSIRLHNADFTSKSFILNALVKLSVRFTISSRQKIVELIAPFKTSLSIELQQRSLEYSSILDGRWDQLRGQVLNNVPHVDPSVLRRRRAAFDNDESSSSAKGNNSQSLSNATSGTTATLSANNISFPTTTSSFGVHSSPAPSSLIDLDDIFGLGAATSPSPSANTGATVAASGAIPQSTPATSNVDLLSDIFSTITVNQTLKHPHSSVIFPQQPTMQQSNNFASQQQPIFVAPQGGIASSLTSYVASTVASPDALQTIVAYEKDGLKVLMETSKPNPLIPANTQILCKFCNSADAPFDDFVFQAAVPKYMKLEMLPPSSAIIPAHSQGVVTQVIRINNSMQGEKAIMLKLKIAYKFKEQPVEALTSVTSFPANY